MNDGHVPVVVIGYGNELRSDDGIGPYIARQVAGWHDPAVAAIAAGQLLPELAATLSKAQYAFLVDACQDRDPAAGVQIEPITAANGRNSPFGGHTGDPAWLLELATSAYGRSAQTWLVTIPGQCFAFGNQFSPAAQRGAQQALALIEQQIARTRER